nr:hypothetical protein [Tanacetum cinerariifolium]
DADDELEVEDADVELEGEEPDGVPKAAIGTSSQRAFTVRNFPMGFYEAGESSTARDPYFVGGSTPWALRHDLEALRRYERIREAESETRESSTARDPQFVGGLAPWALRRDLEALRRQKRIREAEWETSRTEVALLGSEAKIEKMEREILHHDLSSVEETLGNVVERLKVLESEENATLKNKLAEKEVLLDLTRMERDRAEK